MDPSGNSNKGKNWTTNNTRTLLTWITIGSCFIKFLDSQIKRNRTFIRVNTLQSIIMNTATGSIGVSQISSIFSQQIQLILTLIFTLMAFTLTITTGVIKVCQIHENLEKSIQIRQEWASFITNISTELQLPMEERQDALKLIRDNKNIYLSLLNKDIEINTIDAAETLRSTENKIKQKIKAYKQYYNSTPELWAAQSHHDLVKSIGISISDITTGIVEKELLFLHSREMPIYYDEPRNKKWFISVPDLSNGDANINILRSGEDEEEEDEDQRVKGLGFMERNRRKMKTRRLTIWVALVKHCRVFYAANIGRRNGG